MPSGVTPHAALHTRDEPRSTRTAFESEPAAEANTVAATVLEGMRGGEVSERLGAVGQGSIHSSEKRSPPSAGRLPSAGRGLFRPRREQHVVLMKPTLLCRPHSRMRATGLTAVTVQERITLTF